MGALTIFHNPKCSKSRETLALLKDRGFAPRIIEYLKDPPTAAEWIEAMAKYPILIERPPERVLAILEP